MITPQTLPPLPNREAPSLRLASLDTLRGFNMFWIIGGAELVRAIAEKFSHPIIKSVSDNLTEHVEWEGFHFHDMIFPLFLFIIGIALPFTMAKRVAQGETKPVLIGKILRRTVTMLLLGLVYSGLLQFKGFDHLRLFGVLQRLAFGYCAAALLLLFTGPRVRLAVVVALLLGYWALLVFVPVPGFPHGDMTPNGNVANYVDRLLLQPGQMYEKYGDPEGPLSTFPAIATALLGVFAGEWLRGSRRPERTALGLALAGIACLALGHLWGIYLPIIKKIWTSSYVLVAGGWSLLLLAAFYYVIDVRGWRRGTLFWMVIGLNPVTIYLAQEIVDFDKIAAYFLGGLQTHLTAFDPLILLTGVLASKWLFLYFLHRQKIHLRV